MSLIADDVIWPVPGRYLLAVSGGADSMALLHLIATAKRDYDLRVAHFDHGLRPGSAEDGAFVENAAAHYGLPFISHAANLGKASESEARAARYGWLDEQRRVSGAVAIATAHHADDLVETSLLNLARGTGRRGLAPMSGAVVRPLIEVWRRQLRAYARDQELVWREDPTNDDRANPRNFLRHELLTIADEAWKKDYLSCVHEVQALNHEVDNLIGGLDEGETARQHLSLTELAEVILYQADQRLPGVELSRRLLGELAWFAKTGRPGKKRDLTAELVMKLEQHNFQIVRG